MRHSEVITPFANSRRRFLRSVSLAAATTAILTEAKFVQAGSQAATSTVSQTQSVLDEERMRELAAWTALTMDTPNPVPFGADIVHSQTGESLMRATNAVGPEHDPSAHAEE